MGLSFDLMVLCKMSCIRGEVQPGSCKTKTACMRGGGAGGRTQVQDNTYIAVGFDFAQISDPGLI